MAFERFIELAMPDNDPLFDRCIYMNPGNHDHHLWASARETQYLEFICSKSHDDYLPVPWHTTKTFSRQPNETPESNLVTTVLRRVAQGTGYGNLANAVCRVAYPNFGLESPDGQKAVIFHHGHFIEPIYQLMSRLRKLAFPKSKGPTEIWDIEAENSAWIEFFWSTMGTSDSLSADIEAIYNQLQSETEVEKLLGNMTSGIVAQLRKHEDPSFLDRIGGKAIRDVVECFLRPVLGLEVHDKEKELSGSARLGLHRYLEGPLLNQIKDETGRTMPLDLTFVFGHTHKPFNSFLRNLEGYPEWVRVYNSGGWVVDTPKPNKLHGGAAILINDELDVVSLNLYHESQKESDFHVYLAEAEREGIDKSQFFERLSELVDPRERPWSDFSVTVSKACAVYAKNQKQRIESD